MSDNRSQDIKLIKLAIKVEKDALLFFEKFFEKIGEESLADFLRQVHGEITEDLARFEEILQPLEAGQEGSIEDLSLDDYARKSTRGEKFFPHSRVVELLEGKFNPIHTLGVCAQILKDIAGFYLESATNIFYETEKGVFIEMADRKKEQGESLSRRKREIISRFP